MNSTTTTLTGSGAGVTNTDPIRVDWRASTTSLSFATDGSTTGFTVQYTLTKPEDYSSASAWASGATWHDSSIAAATADEAGNITGSVQGVRLQANATGTDTGTLIVAQSEY